MVPRCFVPRSLRPSQPRLKAAGAYTPRRKAIPRAVLFAVGGLLVGCAQQAKVTTYTAAIEQNFTTACEARTDVSSGNASLCTCVFAKLKAGMEFVDFKKLDADLQQATKDATVRSAEDIRRQFPAYAVIVASCVESGPNAP